MSGGGWKKPFEDVAQMDSRGIAQIGRTLHWQGLTDEAKHNEANPGRAITKAGINALAWYLGGEAAGAFGGSGAAAGAAGEGAYDAMTAEQIAQNLAPVAAGENVGTMGGALAAGSPEAAGNAGLMAASAAPSMSAQELGQIANADSLNTGLLGTVGPNAAPESLPSSLLPQGAGNTMESGMTDSGYTPSSLKFALRNANAQNGTPLGQNVGNYFNNAQTNLMNGSTYNKFLANMKGPQGRQLAMKTGMKMMTPQQPRAMPQGAPAPQGQQAPLTNPYQNSLTMNQGNLTEQQKARLRAMGYPV